MNARRPSYRRADAERGALDARMPLLVALAIADLISVAWALSALAGVL